MKGINSNPFNLKYSEPRIGTNDNSNLDNMKPKNKPNYIPTMGDLVKVETIYNTFLMGRIDGIGLKNSNNTLYFKLKADDGTTNEVEYKNIKVITLIKTQQQLFDEKEKKDKLDTKQKYPLVINYFTYTISICENLAQVLIYKATRQNELHIVDLSIFTNEEILSLYNNDRDFLTEYIIKKTDVDNYDVEIDKKLLEASELEDEQDSLYDDIDKMIKEFKVKGEQ